jgi:hypothetical protein
MVRQVLVVVEGRCQVESYTYRLQADDSLESWLIRWEYHREPPRSDYPYPPAHVHVRGTFPDQTTSDRLHIPTRRVPLELVIWHLISDWGVETRAAEARASRGLDPRVRRALDISMSATTNKTR